MPISSHSHLTSGPEQRTVHNFAIFIKLGKHGVFWMQSLTSHIFQCQTVIIGSRDRHIARLAALYWFIRFCTEDIVWQDETESGSLPVQTVHRTEGKRAQVFGQNSIFKFCNNEKKVKVRSRVFNLSYAKVFEVLKRCILRHLCWVFLKTSSRLIFFQLRPRPPLPTAPDRHPPPEVRPPRHAHKRNRWETKAACDTRIMYIHKRHWLCQAVEVSRDSRQKNAKKVFAGLPKLLQLGHSSPM